MNGSPSPCASRRRPPASMWSSVRSPRISSSPTRRARNPTVTNFYGRPTPDTMVYSWFHSKGSWNQNLWKGNDPEIDQLLDKARETKSPEEQAALYKRFQAILEERGPAAVVFVSNHADGVHNSVLNFHASPRLWIDFREVDLKQ